jgi:hypothetical protein
MGKGIAVTLDYQMDPAAEGGNISAPGNVDKLPVGIQFRPKIPQVRNGEGRPQGPFPALYQIGPNLVKDRHGEGIDGKRGGGIGKKRRGFLPPGIFLPGFLSPGGFIPGNFIPGIFPGEGYKAGGRPFPGGTAGPECQKYDKKNQPKAGGV